MIPGYQTVDHDKIERMLAARLEALGIPAEALEEPVGDGTLRQRAGRIAAQKQGVNLGRPSKKCSDKRFSKIRDLYESHQISAEEAAQRLHVSVSTFYRWLRESREHD